MPPLPPAARARGLTFAPSHRPPQFKKASAYPEDSDEEESTVGKMPPSDSEDES